MSAIWAYIIAHQTLFTLAVYMVFSAATGAMPMPDNTSGKFYRWFFQFMNSLAANISRAKASFGTMSQQPPAQADPPSVPIAANPIVPPKP
jgi:hypothetical protein